MTLKFDRTRWTFDHQIFIVYHRWRETKPTDWRCQFHSRFLFHRTLPQTWFQLIFKTTKSPFFLPLRKNDEFHFNKKNEKENQDYRSTLFVSLLCQWTEQENLSIKTREEPLHKQRDQFCTQKIQQSSNSFHRNTQTFTRQFDQENLFTDDKSNEQHQEKAFSRLLPLAKFYLLHLHRDD